MPQASLAELTESFRHWQWPETPESQPTFFSIAGFPHYENVLSNVYAFFFRTNEPHGLGRLCFDALLDVVISHSPELPWPDTAFQHVHALRELTVSDRQRLDILLHDGPDGESWQNATAALLIENKVYHWLANDLDNYWESINSESIGQRKRGIVLGLRPEVLPDSWIYVTHQEWATAVERRIGSRLYRADPRYVTLLLEMIANIRTMSQQDESFDEQILFFQQHRAAISRAEKIRSDVFNQVPTVIQHTLARSYGVWFSAGSKREGWLTIYHHGNQHLQYILGYYQVFHDEELSHDFRITLITKQNDGTADAWQANLLSVATAHIENARLEADNGAPYHVLGKTYSLVSADDFRRFPQLVAEYLRRDWQPLEQYWLDKTAPVASDGSEQTSLHE